MKLSDIIRAAQSALDAHGDAEVLVTYEGRPRPSIASIA